MGPAVDRCQATATSNTADAPDTTAAAIVRGGPPTKGASIESTIYCMVASGGSNAQLV